MEALEARTMAKVSRRLIPFVIICYFVAFLDRVNLGFAALEMNKDLGFSATVYGLGAGMFFISYFSLETPSNLILVRTGARIWIARIMFTWGILSGAMAFVQGETSFYIVRFLLGAAEAGFFPGILFYLTLFFPAAYRGRMVAMFMVAIPFSAVIGSPLSSAILYADGFLGLRGWQWIFISEAVPAVILSGVVLWYLTDTPAQAHWLAADERDWLVQRQAAERRQREAVHNLSVLEVLRNPRVLTLGLSGFGIVFQLRLLLFPAADRQSVWPDQHADRPRVGGAVRGRRHQHDLVRTTLRPSHGTPQPHRHRLHDHGARHGHHCADAEPLRPAICLIVRRVWRVCRAAGVLGHAYRVPEWYRRGRRRRVYQLARQYFWLRPSAAVGAGTPRHLRDLRTPIAQGCRSTASQPAARSHPHGGPADRRRVGITTCGGEQA